MGKPVAKEKSREIDLRPYAGRWVALIRGQVAGVGLTPEEARITAKLARPKEDAIVRFVPVEQRIGKQTGGKQTDGVH
jgi:hypothetical protein